MCLRNFFIFWFIAVTLQGCNAREIDFSQTRNSLEECLKQTAQDGLEVIEAMIQGMAKARKELQSLNEEYEECGDEICKNFVIQEGEEYLKRIPEMIQENVEHFTKFSKNIRPKLEACLGERLPNLFTTSRASLEKMWNDARPIIQILLEDMKECNNLSFNLFNEFKSCDSIECKLEIFEEAKEHLKTSPNYLQKSVEDFKIFFENAVPDLEQNLSVARKKSKKSLDICLKNTYEDAKDAIRTMFDDMNECSNTLTNLAEEFKKCFDSTCKILISRKAEEYIKFIPGLIQESVDKLTEFVTNIGPNLNECLGDPLLFLEVRNTAEKCLAGTWEAVKPVIDPLIQNIMETGKTVIDLTGEFKECKNVKCENLVIKKIEDFLKNIPSLVKGSESRFDDFFKTAIPEFKECISAEHLDLIN